MASLAELMGIRSIPDAVPNNPWDRAAYRQRTAVQPAGGRQDAGTGDFIGEMLIPQNAADVAMLALGGGPLGAVGRKLGSKALAALLGLAGAASYSDEAEASFLGRAAKSANLGLLSLAEKMFTRGESKKTILDETGWFRGRDGQWRFEMSDDTSKYIGARPDEQPIESAFQHERLYEAYPELRTINYQEVQPLDWRGRGSYLDTGGAGEKFIDVAENVPDKRSIILHELQHGIQGIEGFDRGANTVGLRPGTPAWRIYQERLYEMGRPLSHEEYSRQANYEGLAPLSDYKDYIKTTKNIPSFIDRAAQEYAVREAYRRSAGEVEARNVQARMNMTPESRRSVPPWETEDVPPNMQILRKWGIAATPLAGLMGLGSKWSEEQQ